MIITEDIKNALASAIRDAGNPYRFSMRLDNIRHTTIRDWISGKTKSISDENWQKIYPLISRWLPALPFPAEWPEFLNSCPGADEEYTSNELKQMLFAAIGFMEKEHHFELIMFIKKKFPEVFDQVRFACGMPNSKYQKEIPK